MANSEFVLGCAGLLAISVLTGYARAAAALRTVTPVLLLLNLVPAGLLFTDLQKTLARIYRERQVYLVLTLILVMERSSRDSSCSSAMTLPGSWAPSRSFCS
jgi:hypothetical protein